MWGRVCCLATVRWFSFIFVFSILACGNARFEVIDGADAVPTKEEENPGDPGDPEPDPSPDPQPDSEPDPSPDPEPDPSPDPQPDPEPDPSPDPQPDPEPDPSPDPQPDPEPDPSPDPDPPTGSFPTDPSEVGITEAACPNWDAVKTTVSGGLNIKDDGAVIENYDIVGGEIDVNAANVTVRCTRIVTTARYPINCATFGGNTCGGGLLVEHVEAIGNGGPNGSTSTVAIIFASNSTIRSSYLMGGADILKIHGSGNTVEGSYIGCQRGKAGAHMDTLQVRQVSDLTLRNNTMVGTGCPDSEHNPNDHNSANVFIQNADGDAHRILIEGNHFIGGGKLIHFSEQDSKPSNTIEHVTILNNVAAPDYWRFFSFLPDFENTDDGVCSEWDGNAFTDGASWNWSGQTGGPCNMP